MPTVWCGPYGCNHIRTPPQLKEDHETSPCYCCRTCAGIVRTGCRLLVELDQRRTQILSAISDSSFDNVETLTSDDGKGQYRLTGDNDAELIVDAQTMLPVSVSSYDGLSFDASDWNQIAAQVAPQVG